MDELTPNQLNRLTELLMNCAPFRNELQLRAMFIDPRLRPWQHLIPASSENFYDLIKRIIALLVSKRNRDSENALILFLDVLADNIDEGDYCHEQILTLASDLRPILNIKPDIFHPQSKPQRPSANNRLELYTILEDRFDDGEIRGLCFELNVDYQNLPGKPKETRLENLFFI
ncbi:MAG: hypothetical protein HC804_03715 [Anaerolineae bacterium]|nr:hypothetical protein [Anaerolineae bacterium]